MDSEDTQPVLHGREALLGVQHGPQNSWLQDTVPFSLGPKKRIDMDKTTSVSEHAEYFPPYWFLLLDIVHRGDRIHYVKCLVAKWQLRP